MTQVNKEEKYDRQLRLWANSGQSSLESAKILIIQPTSTTSELLKNLILPGIGHFTIIDYDSKINDVDLSNNFYLGDDDLGKSKIDVLASNLQELNHDVSYSIQKIDPSQGSIEDFINAQNDLYWSQFDLVISNYQLESLITKLNDLKIPIMIINSIGFYGFLRIFKSTFEIYETHPQSLIDLRILSTWDELQNYSDSIDLHSLDIEQHSQIPYLIIQLKAVENWRLNHDNQLPTTSQEKKQFKELIRSWKKDHYQLNFDEAIDNSHKIFNNVKIPSNVKDIFSHIDEYYNDFNKRSVFWILVKALKEFVDLNDGFLPLSGELPDMDSTTENYIKLQNIYLKKAQEDLAKLKDILIKLRLKLGKESLPISDEILKNFAKNSKFLYFSQNSNKLIPLNFNKIFDESHNSLILLSFFIIERFQKDTKKFPTLQNIDELIKISHDFVTSDDDSLHLILHELVRSEGQELNNIASLMGGIGSQEAIKIITKQYIPLDNTLIYDGINSVTERWKLD
ncbi:NEDD8-activating enzyme E1 regulatory subunit [Wickerhamomyces ciferrii]|uniref:NEDD8-activating enzyme E1 regulatory subunit n=1 Tax=Wickerhamomyces ciferrii (strain ATCC 14091 / BCRC 22168 / CBS 111 / JCM 3599 / NBRC 0793 / NRRL Y-1031 F-60-10) TaxID=1206466 RepID=K0KQG1_WICCF|nr:NEDD8-activating enzyme E1 regulatory subunit [Wickerhamomyces ciferrii]CCH43493.1 NEDD8-activating enzyme E1 regulatory subunit [Wickerhamomyces ciferrii]